jgi:outer membrane PBP1 activator LpoA protein
MMVEQQSYEPGFTGWMELALQVRLQMVNQSSANQGSVNNAAEKWALNHPGHPVNESNYADLVRRYSALYPVPSRVAVLLPTQGGLAAVSNAIRDGIVSAYLDNPGDAQLSFYASGNTPESAISAYMQAREDGAVQIIGPLDLQSTRALSTLSDLTIPVLLLNEQASNVSAISGPKGSVNSLLMSQTEEAALIAERALSQGYKRAVVFVPDTEWGTRVEEAFSQAFNQGNGRIIALSRFNQNNNDQSVMLTRLLRIEESKQREAELRDWLGIPMDFEPSRRDDFDFIFMAATPTEGRELKPLLRFHDVGDVPVLAMGRVYSGEVLPTADQDLNSVVVPSTRWHLQAAQSKKDMPKSVRNGAYGSFFAIGEDAWRLLPWLPLMKKDRDLIYPGQLGNLRIEADGRVYRDPAWAQFNNGKLAPYQWPDVY